MGLLKSLINYRVNITCFTMMSLMLLSLSAQVIETNTVVHRKPPFNGSIFGKRSVLPALFGQQQHSMQQQQPSELIKSQQQALSSAVSFEDTILATVENYLASQTAATTGSEYVDNNMSFCHLIINNCRSMYNNVASSQATPTNYDNSNTFRNTILQNSDMADMSVIR